jgi:DNA-binding NarL/FixJ family response regulator
VRQSDVGNGQCVCGKKARRLRNLPSDAVVYHSAITQGLADWVAAKARAKQYCWDLTPRQREVVQLVAEGRSINEIADILNVSHKTLEFHKHRIMECFHPKSNADLVLFALDRGIIHRPSRETAKTKTPSTEE